ncbi:DUF6430 domain-containing protein [Candidatus Haliotispira prima]|uniref:DUF6430 domain-containing protein n=1 Tax=Candidatus Haliotispira prima TaxID=3034016 RepID=A0ABY8MJE1_9SPIO|nr:DUF6430 domain-containing protein [Candidatus Haliotispira prima]
MLRERDGNIFDRITDDIQVVIPVNSSFDCVVDGVTIDKNSLHGQLINNMGSARFYNLVQKRIIQNDIYDYDGRLIPKNFKTMPKEFQRSMHDIYPIGFYTRIENFILLITTHFNESGQAYINESNGSAENTYKAILRGLTSAINSCHQGTIRVPFIGTSVLSRNGNNSEYNHDDMKRDLKRCLNGLIKSRQNIEIWSK